MTRARLEIAGAVWSLGMALAAPASVAGFILVLSSMDWGGTGRSEPSSPYIIILTIAFAWSVFLTWWLGAFAARTSDGVVHAGPVVLGCGAGFFLGMILGNTTSLEVNGIVLGFTLFPLAGSLIGTFVPVALPGGVAGLAVGGLGMLSVLLMR